VLCVVRDIRAVADTPLAHARALSECGYDIHVAAPVDPEAEAQSEAAARAGAGLGVHLYRVPRLTAYPFRALASLRALARCMRAVRPRLVHCIGLGPTLEGGVIARAKGIATVHNLGGIAQALACEQPVGAMRRFMLARALDFVLGHRKALITVDSAEEKALLVRFGVADPGRVFIARGVGADLRRHEPRPTEARPQDGPLVVICASPLTVGAGARDFITVARRLRAKGSVARFVLIGARAPRSADALPEQEFLHALAEGVVEWWGDSRELVAALRQADIFCLPAHESEGVPRVLIEAAASGLPLVATDLPGCRQVVRQGANGLLVPPQCEGALESAVMRLIDDPAFRRAAGAMSREIAFAEFSLDAVITSVLTLYRLAAERPVAGAAL
jgi:glycosyltransferase involved in cell wall biosynthesis